MPGRKLDPAFIEIKMELDHCGLMTQGSCQNNRRIMAMVGPATRKP